MALSAVTKLTYRYERLRAISSGILETAGSTFLLLIVVRWFSDAGPTAKALVAGGGSFGLAISPVLVSAVARLRWKTSIAASRLAVAGAACFLVMTLAPSLPVFVIGSILA